MDRQRSRDSRSHSKKKPADKTEAKQDRPDKPDKAISDQPEVEKQISSEPTPATKPNYDKMYTEFVASLPSWNQPIFEARRAFFNFSPPTAGPA